MSMVKRPKIITPKKVLVLNDVRSGLMQHYLPKTIHDVFAFDLIFSALYFRPYIFDLIFSMFYDLFSLHSYKKWVQYPRGFNARTTTVTFCRNIFPIFSFRFLSTLCQSQKVLFVPLYFKRRI